jgi:hypothetical protein
MTREPFLCNLFARQQGLDPIGYTGTLDALLAFELPLPWPRGVFESRRKLPHLVHDAIAWFTRETPYRLRPLILGPDPEYSVPGKRRVMWFARPGAPFSEYERSEYLVDEDSLGDLVAALVRGRGRANEFEGDRVTSTARDLLVCTHGAQDTACGRFGVPFYRQLRDQAQRTSTRIWRVSHFGGHVFAPTVLELPSARFWAYLEEESCSPLLTRSGSAAQLRGNYRGWAGLEGPFLQALERELLVREGWSWLDRPKSAQVLRQDPADEPQWAEVRIDAWRGGAATGYLGRVEISHCLPIRPRSDSSELRPYAQYSVTQLETLPAAQPEAVVGA